MLKPETVDEKLPPEKPENCPAETTLELLSGKWRLMIIFWLLQGSRRFNQLQRDLGGITHRTLARTLREMAAGGLLTRTDHGEIPPRVEYALTAKGRSLEAVLVAMATWAEDYPSAAPALQKRSSSEETGPEGASVR